MKRSIRIMLASLVAVAVVALAGAGGAVAADKYIPFVTDFPKGEAAEEPYRPFATDFGIAPRPAGGGFVSYARGSQVSAGRAWEDVALGGALGIAFAGLVAGTALAGSRLRRDRRHGGRLEPQAAPPR